MAEFVTKKEHGRRLATLIVCIVICTLSLALGIYALTTANSIEQKENTPGTIKDLKGQISKQVALTTTIEGNFRDFSQGIGWNHKGNVSYDRHPTTGVSGNELKSYLDHWVTELAKPGFDVKDFKPWLQEGAGNPLLLTDLYNRLAALETDYRGRNQTLDGAIKAAEAASKAALDDMNAVEQKNLDDIDKQLKEDYKRLLKDLGTKERQHGEELVALEVDTFNKQRDLTELKNRNLQSETRLVARKNDLQTRINWITYRREEAKERKEPDGVILAVDEKDNIAFIDLLHADRIFNGTRFKVYSLEKGGVKLDKGEIEVIQVRTALSSKVAIIRTNDAKEPVRPGDRIYNEFYEKGKTRYIAIAGRLTGKLSNEEASRKIREFGDVFQEKVDERTNYVIVGEGYAGPDGVLGVSDTDAAGQDDHGNMKLAREWGVKILLERHLYDYLGVP